MMLYILYFTEMVDIRLLGSIASPALLWHLCCINLFCCNYKFIVLPSTTQFLGRQLYRGWAKPP